MLAFSTYLFDVGGTLITFDSARRARAYCERAAQVGITVSPQETLRVLDALDAELPERTKPVQLSLLSPRAQRAFWVDFWAEGFLQIGVSAPDAHRFARELLDPVNGGNFQHVYPDVVPALQSLRARGKQLGIISNFSPNCEPLLKQLGIAAYFDFFIVSGIVGIEKPDPRIFELAVRASGQLHAELVYIGDSIFHDVEGAQNAGISGVLIDRSNRFPDFHGARIRDLREL